MHTPHLTEDVIEQYAMGKLSPDATEFAENHLLVCQQCRDEVELIVTIVAALREDVARERNVT